MEAPSVITSSAAPAPLPTGAPPEPVPVDVAAVKNAFASAGNAKFLDLSGRFTLDDRAKISKAAEDLAAKTGAKAWILALPGKTDVAAFAPVYKDLHLGARDAFFVFNAETRHLQTVSKSVGNDVLKTTNKSFYQSRVQGTVDMMDELGRVLTTAAPTTASTAVPVKAPQPSNTAAIQVLLLAVGLAILAWLVIKRKPVTPLKPPPRPESKTDDTSAR